MTAVWVVLAALVVMVPVAWVLLKAFVGFATPPEKSGRAYLDRKLMEFGIPLSAIPSALRDEIVSYCLDTARGLSMLVQGKGEHGQWRTNFVSQIESSAFVIRSLLLGEKSFEGGPVHGLLVKHGAIK